MAHYKKQICFFLMNHFAQTLKLNFLWKNFFINNLRMQDHSWMC